MQLMSDSFERVVDIEVSADDAPALCQEVVDRLRALGIITGRLTKECVLGGTGYLPGESIANFYEREKRESAFWELHTCGVEPTVGWHFNVWALGEAFDSFVCPVCQAEIGPQVEEFHDALGEKITECLEKTGNALVACPHCQTKSQLTKWGCRPPLGFGNLSFSFWNWPPFDSPAWKIDIAAILREVTGHEVVMTYGRI